MPSRLRLVLGSTARDNLWFESISLLRSRQRLGLGDGRAKPLPRDHGRDRKDRVKVEADQRHQKPRTTPARCGRPKPNFTPEVMSIKLFGPAATTPNAAKPARTSRCTCKAEAPVNSAAVAMVLARATLSSLSPRRAGQRVAVAIAVAIVVWETCNGAMERQLARLAREGHYVRAARLRTVLPMLRTTLILTILTVFGLTALSEIGVNIAPLLAGAGIVGIAVGFGSQKLVQDVVTGMFLLLENAMQVGDFVTVSGLSGTVENLDSNDPASRRRRFGAYRPVQFRDQRHQHQSRHRQCRGLGQSRL